MKSQSIERDDFILPRGFVYFANKVDSARSKVGIVKGLYKNITEWSQLDAPLGNGWRSTYLDRWKHDNT